VNRSVVFAASAMSMIGSLAGAEAPSVRPGLWETIGQTTIEFAPALEHEAKPAVSERSRLCVNDGKALGPGPRATTLRRFVCRPCRVRPEGRYRLAWVEGAVPPVLDGLAVGAVAS